MYRAYLQFYKMIFPFVAAFSIICIAFFGLFLSFLLFAIVGPAIGMLSFKIFYKDQFYFYYNLGITLSKLMGVSFLINLFLGIPIYSIIILILSFFLGSFTIT